METQEILDLVETEVATAAKNQARTIFEWVTTRLSEDVAKEVEAWIEEDGTTMEDHARNLIQPAYMEKLHEALAGMHQTTARGWSDVFWSNLGDIGVE